VFRNRSIAWWATCKAPVADKALMCAFLLPADQLCVARHGGALRLAVRIGDTRPTQMQHVHVRMYLYRWSRSSVGAADPSNPHEPFQMRVRITARPRSSLIQKHLELDLGREGADRLCVRLLTMVILQPFPNEDNPDL